MKSKNRGNESVVISEHWLPQGEVLTGKGPEGTF